MEKKIDIICVGEVLIDFIGHEVNTLANTKDYHRFLGGSPTNVAVNAKRLGLNVSLIATCGNDGLGHYICEKLELNQVDTSRIRRSETKPTSVIFISRSTDTPDFIPFREADIEILDDQISDALLASAKIYHTTCFALSKKPAQTSILNGAKKAKELGLQLSIDINYSEKIWPDREEALAVIQEYVANNPLVKLSDDDCYRLFGETKSEAFIFNYFHELGADTVCLTKGKNGVKLSNKQQGEFFQEGLQVENVKDTTGAGDAFWTGFLYAQLLQKDFVASITIAQKLAVLKLQNVGRLPDGIDIPKYLHE